jgi:protein-arginine deiminase
VLSDAEVGDLLKQDLKLLVEGLNFATSAELSAYLDECERDALILEVAPFLLVPHSQGVEANYVVKVPDQPDAPVSLYVDGFRRACFAAGVQTVVMLANSDVWIEDEMCWGYSETPRVYMPVVLHLNRLRELKANVRALLEPGVGYSTIFDYGPDPPIVDGITQGTDDINFGGNLEVTPPTRRFPFGRVYYGSVPSTGNLVDALLESRPGRQIDPRYQAFFHRQRVQPPIDLNTDWLMVGHVDEVITFVPKTGGGFALLLASPQLAMDMVGHLPGGTPLDPKYKDQIAGLLTASDLLQERTLGMTLEQYNELVDSRIFGGDHASPDRDSIKGRLKEALDLDEADIFEVPVLYYHYSSEKSSGSASLTPGMVNLNSMGRSCLVPEPFLDSFKIRFSSIAAGIDQCPTWIDDWIYHCSDGEVHCASNTRRKPFGKKWWTP